MTNPSVAPKQTGQNNSNDQRETNQDLCQYVITHKKFDQSLIQDDASFIPLQVGFQENLGYLRDNTGDHISQKNKTWCELTGLYWIWKNDTTSDAISISHYRRYFGKHKPLTQKEILDLLKTNDVLIAEFEPYRETVYEQYCIDSGFAKDLDALREILNKQHPEDVAAFDQIMKQGGISQYNMMACKKEVFDAYCEWLFPLLAELEKQVDLTNYNDYQKRIFGFLSERLLNVYILARNLKVTKLPILQSEMSTKEKMRLKLRRIKNRSIFKKNHKSS